MLYHVHTGETMVWFW